MAEMPSESPVEKLWKEYGTSFSEFDDMSLARWCSQTLSQIHGRTWRLSHPLIGCYRLAAQQAHDRQIWLKHLVNMPHGYQPSQCCRAPLLPLVTRDISHCGLFCQHCGGCVWEFDDLPNNLKKDFIAWADRYETAHEVAHWEESQRKSCPDYDEAFERAAQQAEGFLVELGSKLAPQLIDLFPAIVWEDQDECLEVRPEDIELFGK